MARYNNYWFQSPADNSYLTTGLVHEIDVLIIGGGLSGLSMLYRLALSGNLNVVLLEQGSLGSHASGRHTGHLMTGNFSAIPQINKSHGAGAANTYWTFSRQANESLQGLIKSHKLNCSLQQKGGFHAASAITDLDEQSKAYSMLSDFGLEDAYSKLDARESAALLNTKLFKGGIYVPEECVLDPFQLVKELSDTCEQAGRHIIENAQVDGVTRDEDRLRVHVRHRGDILAKHVVYCMGAYTSDLIPSVKPYMRNWQEHAIITKRFDDRIAHDIMPSVPVRHRDKSLLVHNNRLLVGGLPQSVDLPDDGGYNNAIYDRLRHFVNTLYPGLLKRFGVDFIWSSIIGTTTDGLPLVGPVPERPNEYLCTGFGAQNLGFSLECSNIISDYIQIGNCDRPEATLFRPSRF